MDTKHCNGCNKHLPTTMYWFAPRKKSNNRYGFTLRDLCRNCDKKRKAESQKRNRESANVRNRRYAETKGNKQRREQYATDAEYRQKMIERSAEFQKNNPDYVNKKNRMWLKRNPERAKEIWKVQRANAMINNPERLRSTVRNRRARLRQASGSHTAQDILDLYDEQEGRCLYCGITLHNEYHVDHIHPLSRGGSNDKDNLCCACPDCNLSKADKTVDEWKAMRGW